MRARGDVAWFTVYQREPHDRQLAFKDLEQPATWEERAALARRMRDDHGVTGAILVDSMDDASRACFGDLPSPAIAIGPDGRVLFKLPWAEPEVLGPRLEAHLKARDGGEPAVAPAAAPGPLGAEAWREAVAEALAAHADRPLRRAAALADLLLAPPAGADPVPAWKSLVDSLSAHAPARAWAEGRLRAAGAR